MYPEARMVEPMKIWKLPDGKENKLSEVCQSGEYFLQEKIDGYWYQYEKTTHNAYLFSRNVSRTTGLLSEKGANVPHIMEALNILPAGTILIGEIYYPGGTSKTVTTVMGCLAEEAIKRQNGNPIHYYIHDIISYDNVDLVNCPAILRYKILEKIYEKHHLNQYNFLKLAEKFETNLEEKISEILNRGGEGGVLKKKDLPYYPGKRPAWSTVKVKKMDSVDLICIGFCNATKEYTGKELDSWPFWILEDNFGNECGRSNAGGYNHSDDHWYDRERHCEDGFKWVPVTKGYYYGWKTAMEIGAYDDNDNIVMLGTVSSGLTDKDREMMSKSPEDYLNHVFALNCMEKDNKEHTLRHPIIVGRRDDKPAKDCKISEIFS